VPVPVSPKSGHPVPPVRHGNTIFPIVSLGKVWQIRQMPQDFTTLLHNLTNARKTECTILVLLAKSRLYKTANWCYYICDKICNTLGGIHFG
jgi:hypothetical protein